MKSLAIGSLPHDSAAFMEFETLFENDFIVEYNITFPFCVFKSFHLILIYVNLFINLFKHHILIDMK